MRSQTPATENITICAGIPSGSSAPEGGSSFPDTAIDMAKVIRGRGINPIFEVPKEDRQYVSHNAADVWLQFFR